GRAGAVAGRSRGWPQGAGHGRAVRLPGLAHAAGVVGAEQRALAFGGAQFLRLAVAAGRAGGRSVGEPGFAAAAAVHSQGAGREPGRGAAQGTGHGRSDRPAGSGVAGADVRLRAARERTGDPAGRGGEPAPGRAAGHGQGRPRPAGPDGGGGAALAGALPGRGAPAACGTPGRTLAVRPARGRGADAAGGVAPGQAPCRHRGHRPGAPQPARAAPQLRHPPAQPRRRPARAADAAGPQLTVDHADLHAGRAREAEATGGDAPPAGLTRLPVVRESAGSHWVLAVIRILLAVLATTFSLSACAEPAGGPEASGAAPATLAAGASGAAKPAAGTAEARAVAAIAKLNPDVKVEHVSASPLPGFTQAIAAGQVIYVSNDGR